jgi:hypothetical protein
LPKVILFVLLLSSCASAHEYFAIKVVDDQTGRGVPLVELRTVNDIKYYTDSNGIAAVLEPGLMNQNVFFNVKSHGYEFPADGFGSRGKAFELKPGGSATLKIKRLNIAERLYRITGQGIYRDSVLVGEKFPIKEPVLNGKVLGQDSVQMTEYHGKLFWTFGDTNKPSYPLGHFGTSGATSLKPEVGRASVPAGGLDPNVGIDLMYFVGPDGFSRPMCPLPGPGPKWLDSLVVLKDDAGTDRLLSRFVRVKNLGETLQRGWVIFNDKTETFELLADWALDQPWWPCCHAWVAPASAPAGTPPSKVDYVYFAYPYPHVRVAAKIDALKNQAEYQAFTCLAPGTAYKKGAAKLDRSADGKLNWNWKTNTGYVSDDQQKELLNAGLIKPDECWYGFKNAETGKPILAHGGSVAFNAYRKRWIMVFHSKMDSPSNLGEVYYAESETLEGPWHTARKIVTHDKYSFYNVEHHPLFDQDGGRVIYFEGTYTTMFSGNPEPTPRYEYNQMMYRLDLGDARLQLAK